MTEKATFAGGCFWCTEAVFKRLKGVISVTPGYSGGTSKNPSYEQVSSGTTGHAEAVEIVFDPSIISYSHLLTIFWHTHNPTTRNQQGADNGTQYRSAIFYHSQAQKEFAEKSKRDIEEGGFFKDPIVTEILPFISFYKAEEYHMDYYARNVSAPYCTFVIDPKIKKLLEEFGNDVKDNYKH